MCDKINTFYQIVDIKTMYFFEEKVNFLKLSFLFVNKIIMWIILLLSKPDCHRWDENVTLTCTTVPPVVYIKKSYLAQSQKDVFLVHPGSRWVRSPGRPAEGCSPEIYKNKTELHRQSFVASPVRGTYFILSFFPHVLILVIQRGAAQTIRRHDQDQYPSRCDKLRPTELWRVASVCESADWHPPSSLANCPQPVGRAFSPTLVAMATNGRGGCWLQHKGMCWNRGRIWRFGSGVWW